MWNDDLQFASQPNAADGNHFPAESLYLNQNNQSTSMLPATGNFERHIIAPEYEVGRIQQQQQAFPQHMNYSSAGGMRESDSGPSNRNFGATALPNVNMNATNFRLATGANATHSEMNMQSNVGIDSDWQKLDRIGQEIHFGTSRQEPPILPRSDMSAGMMTEHDGNTSRGVFKVPKLPNARGGQKKKTATETRCAKTFREKKTRIEDVDLATWNGVVVLPRKKGDAFRFYPRQGPQTTTQTAVETTKESVASDQSEDPGWTWTLIHEAHEALGYY